jgi:hypothetical protein
VTFPKAERPFKPGEFSTGPAPDESTRIAPLDATGSGNRVQGSVVSTAPRPAAGRQIEEDNPTRMEGPGMPPRLGHTGQMPQAGHDPNMGMAPVQAIPQGMYPPGMQQPPMMQPGMQPMQQGMMPMQGMQPGMMPGGSGPYPQQGYPGGSGPYNSMAPGAMQSGGYGSMTGGQLGGPPPPPEGSVPYYVAKYKELSPPKRILVILAPFCLIASGYLILFDDDGAPAPIATTTLDGGMEGGSLAAGSGGPSAAPPPSTPPSTPPPITPPPITPPQPACPPGFVPYTIAINGQIPCVPIGTPMPPPPNGGAVTPLPNPIPASPVEAGAPPPSTPSTKTLERQAVDAVAIGEYAKAAAIYDQLHQQNPNNRVYAEAARILRAKIDAGQ